MARGAAIADYGVVITGALDHDSVSGGEAATDAARTSPPAPAGVLSYRGSGYARYCGAMSLAEVDGVGS